MGTIANSRKQLDPQEPDHIGLAVENNNNGVPTMVAKLAGGCACGAVLYEFDQDIPLFADHCYCRDCPRASGTAMSSLLFVAKDAFKLIKGRVRYFEVVGGSGGKVSRGFCANCGSPLCGTAANMPGAIGIAVGSLDDPNQYQPEVSVFLDSAPAWAPIDNTLPGFPKLPQIPG
jgi:hypothetical protein